MLNVEKDLKMFDSIKACEYSFVPDCCSSVWCGAAEFQTHLALISLEMSLKSDFLVFTMQLLPSVKPSCGA